MNRYFPLGLLILSLLGVFFVASRAQTVNSTQAGASSAHQGLKWTEPREQALLRKAQNGDVWAQFWLGAGYEQGWFGKADFREALNWFRRAAKGGNPDAQNGLGQMYQDGEGVLQNYGDAAKWYRRAAEHVPDYGGAGQGRNNLGPLYMQGLGVPKDFVKAYMWFSLAHAESNVTDVKAEMTPAEILEAEEMVTEWKNSHSER